MHEVQLNRTKDDWSWTAFFTGLIVDENNLKTLMLDITRAFCRHGYCRPIAYIGDTYEGVGCMGKLHVLVKGTLTDDELAFFRSFSWGLAR